MTEKHGRRALLNSSAANCVKGKGVRMNGRCISQECLENTRFSYTLSLISGKYKMTILYTLMEFGVARFNEMKKYIGVISYKTLSSTLKGLEADQLVHREEYPQIPPQGRVQPHGAGEIPDSHIGRDVRVGGQEQALTGSGKFRQILAAGSAMVGRLYGRAIFENNFREVLYIL